MLRTFVLTLIGCVVVGAGTTAAWAQQEEIEVELRLIALTAASTADTTLDPDALPGQICSVALEQSFVLELWASDVGLSNPGIVGFYVDLAFDKDVLQCDALVHSSLFDLLPEGVCSNETGQVIDFGGIDGTFTGQGVAPEWAKIGHVQMTAIGEGGTLITSSLGLHGIGLHGEDPPPASQIRFGTTAMGVPNCIPAVSEWGVVILTLAVLTAGTLTLMRRRVTT